MPLEWPVQVKAGDRLDLKIHTSRNAAQWQWQVTHHPVMADGQFEPGDILPEQTTRFGELSAFASTEDLTLTPSRNSDGDIDLFILQRINGKLTVAEIAQQTEKRFPNMFSSYERLVERVYKLMTLYAGAG